MIKMIRFNPEMFLYYSMMLVGVKPGGYDIPAGVIRYTRVNKHPCFNSNCHEEDTTIPYQCSAFAISHIDDTKTKEQAAVVTSGEVAAQGSEGSTNKAVPLFFFEEKPSIWRTHHKTLVSY